jgi:hypothetical protein
MPAPADARVSFSPCEPHRRQFLRFAGVTLAGTAWELFGGPGPAPASPPGPATADAVLFLWLPGGVTHHESFDPKPEAAAEIRGELRAIRTNVAGVYFAEVLPRLARHMDKLALVRSFAAGTNDHFLAQAYALSGHDRLPNGILSEPNFGCIVAQQRGSSGGLPGYIAVPGSTRPGPPNTNLFVSAWLGAKYAPFATGGEPRNRDFKIDALALPDDVPAERFHRRQSLRLQVEERLRAAERQADLDDMEQLYGKALELLVSPRVRKAFDLQLEPPARRDRYGHTKLGQRCLLAHRLLEAGARFVMVDYGYDWGEYNNLWDNHCAPGQNQPHISRMAQLPYHLPAVDQAFAALLDDLHASGRLQRTLVVYLTEFGRTPKINSAGGRDHWGYSGSVFFAGGGVRGGQVLGATDKVGGYCTTRTWSPSDAVATVYRAVGIDPHATLLNRENRPSAIQPAGEPIPVF